MPEESLTKYVHLRGRADIRIAADGKKIALYLYDPLTEENIINADNPFVFTHVPSEGHPLKFLSVNIIAEFSKASYDIHEATLKKIYPEITWEIAEEPTEETMDDMNSTDPPKFP